VAGEPDTFDLVTVAGNPLPTPIPPAKAACPVRRVFSARYVFQPDSTYDFLYADKIGCGQALTVPDTTRYTGHYEIIGDTLTVYRGDGDEEFQQFIARRWADSLVGNGGGGAWRLIRRGAGVAPR
jgi:hypothetical protein